jgi:ubiquinone/menaquinone biosynthesis C-methylase UbiE
MRAEIISNQPSRYNFDSAADTYDQWYETVEGKMYDYLEKKAISRYLPPQAAGKQLLDVGCGTGHWSAFFSLHGFQVTGIDISEPMIKIAKSKAIANVSFHLADAHALPFDDNHFDVSAAITTVEFVQDVTLVLQEMLRCTHKPGGRILIGVLNARAPINRRRRKNPDSLYTKAQWFTPRQIKKLLAPLGRVRVVTAGLLSPRKCMLPWSSWMDTVGRLLHIPYGAFIAAQVIT